MKAAPEYRRSTVELARAACLRSEYLAWRGFLGADCGSSAWRQAEAWAEYVAPHACLWDDAHAYIRDPGRVTDPIALETFTAADALAAETL